MAALKKGTTETDSLLCPSYVSKPGAQLFGIQNTDGKITYLKEPIRVDQTFVDEAQNGRPAEERFRFAGKCIEKGCHQWNEAQHNCGLVGAIMERINRPVTQAAELCPIRARCRWFAQNGMPACANCNEVIRNLEIYHFAGAEA